MHADRLRQPLRRLRRALAPAAGGALPDGQLLAQFVATRDEAAFAALVRRHGPMVLGTCRRLVRHAQDAAADVEHHRPVPPHQGGEGGLVALGGEALQELRVRRLGDAAGPGQPPDVL